MNTKGSAQTSNTGAAGAVAIAGGHAASGAKHGGARVLTVTMSDSRKEPSDESGRVLREGLAKAGFTLVSHELLPDEPDMLRSLLKYTCDAGRADAIVITGGTGIGPRDRTIEALAPMLDLELPGFGEAFRRLSFDRIGPRAILSRSLMGVLRGRVVVALPGSPNAVELATTELLVPTLAHAVAVASGKSVHGEAGHDPA